MRHPRATVALVILFWFRIPVVLAIIGAGRLIVGAGEAFNGLYG